MTRTAAPVARYVITAWRSWADADPSYHGLADSLDAARYIASHLTEPLVDVIATEYRASGRPTGGGNVVAVRRTLPHPGTSGPFVPRDDFERIEA